MYTLVIADDEEKLRNGLCKFIDWESLGFRVANSFEDGKDVIEYLSRTPVDVVLADIKMTYASGLDVARYIFENNLRTRVVIISGYKEFEYAKKAIEYNVEHYLLKPADIDEICRVFTEVKRKMDIEEEKRNLQQKERKRVEELVPILREQLFVDIAMGIISTKQEIEKRLQLADLNIDPSHTCCCMISISINGYDDYIKDKWEYGKEQLNTALRNILLESSDNISYFVISNRASHLKMLAIALKKNTLYDFEESVKSHMNDIEESIKNFFGLSISYQLQGLCESLYLLNNAFQPFPDSENTYSAGSITRLIEQFKLLLSKINLGEEESTKNSFQKFIREIGMLSVDSQKKVIFSLISILSEKYKGTGADFLKRALDKLVFTDGQISESHELLTNRNKEILHEIFDGVCTLPLKSSDMIIKKAKEYIENNFSRDISLDEVAEQVFLNPIYFSRFFKQQAGENFIDYLIKVRMNKAIQLLIENKHKIYEISKMVGYKSDKYFARLFKQYTRYSPKDYLRSIMKVSGPVDDK